LIALHELKRDNTGTNSAVLAPFAYILMQISLLALFFLAFCNLASTSNRRRRNRNRLPPITEHAEIKTGNCPNGVMMRKEYRDMTPVEWKTFRDALLSIQLSPSPDGGPYTEWDWWTRMHLDHVPEAHEYQNSLASLFIHLAILHFFHGIAYS